MFKRLWLVLPLLVAGCDLGVPTVPGVIVMKMPESTVSPVPTVGAVSGEAAVRPIASKYAGRFGLSEGLVLAVIAQESAFNALAVSHAGAQGLMQLMPGTVTHINQVGAVTVLDPFDAEQNIAGGTWYLQWVRGMVPDERVAEGEGWKMALAGYNGGIGRVLTAIDKALAGAPLHPKARWADIQAQMPAETQAYVPAVVARWEKYGL